MKEYHRKKPLWPDDLDQKIIQALQIDARESYLSLGQKLGASEGTVRNRVRAAQQKKVIKLKAVVNPTRLGLNFSCTVGLEIDINRLSAAQAMLAESPNVLFLSSCTGVFDLFALMWFRNSAEFDQFMRHTISQLPGIKRTQTFVNMQVFKDFWSADIDIRRLLET
jgi:Lrp/AsnC family transcriptional regulator, regulator for asnA, asnC and gidA